MMSDLNKKTVLIVDDEECNREILANSLTNAGFNTLTAADGESALEILYKNARRVSAILLDLIMPGINGLEVLKKVKQDRQFSKLPIIIQTTQNSSDYIKECIAAGAFYYLAKPYEMSVMKTIVQSAVNDYTMIGELQDTIEQQSVLCKLLSQGTFNFQSPNDVNALTTFISNKPSVSPEIRMGLSELMLNAIEHGNLGISYDEKGQLIEENRWIEEINQRLNSPKYKDRQANLSFEMTENEISFTITDQGEGFDWRKYLTLDPERLYDTHGRGIMIASSFSFTSVQYHGKGNSVTAIAKLEKKQ